MMMFLVLVVIGATVTMMVMMVRRIGDGVCIHVDGSRIFGCCPWFIGLDVGTESVFVSHVIHMTVDPVSILVPVRSFDLVVT